MSPLQTTATSTSEPSGTPDAAPAAATPPARPDYVPEEFWDAEKGLKADEWKTHLEALTAAKGELDALRAGVPADGAYELTFPEGFDAGGAQVDPDDPFTEFAKKQLAAKGLTQDQFSTVLALAAERDRIVASANEEFAKQQRQALGPQAKQRIDAVVDQIKAAFGDLADTIIPGLRTAAQVEAWEARLKQPGFSAAGRTGGGNEIDPAELDKLPMREQLRILRERERRQAG